MFYIDVHNVYGLYNANRRHRNRDINLLGKGEKLFFHLSAPQNRSMLFIDNCLLLISNFKLLFDGNTITYVPFVSYSVEELCLAEETRRALAVEYVHFSMIAIS